MRAQLQYARRVPRLNVLRLTSALWQIDEAATLDASLRQVRARSKRTTRILDTRPLQALFDAAGMDVFQPLVIPTPAAHPQHESLWHSATWPFGVVE